RRKANHRAALATYEIVGRDADGPAEPRGHADDLVGGMDRVRPADFRNRLHILDASEHLDARDGRLQPEQAVEIGDHGGEVKLFLRCLLLHGVVSRKSFGAILVLSGAGGKSIWPSSSRTKRSYLSNAVIPGWPAGPDLRCNCA